MILLHILIAANAVAALAYSISVLEAVNQGRLDNMVLAALLFALAVANAVVLVGFIA